MMTRFGLALLATLGLVLPVHAYASTLVERSLTKLEAGQTSCPDSVDFMVCADPQPGGLLGTPKEFLQMVDEWNVVKPDFVVCAGDMIMGGPPNVLDSMWTEFEGVIETIDAPFFPVPGNHDVSEDPAVQEIYQQRVGPFSYAFSKGSVQVIVMSTEEIGNPDGFSAGQLAWLKDTLRASTAKHIFLSFHAPVFASNWERDWSAAAEIIKGYPVRAVFTGHWHKYIDYGVRDGVRYCVAGSAGGSITDNPAEGDFFCYLHVRVRGDEVSWSVIKPGSVEPADVVTEAKIKRLRELKGILSSEPVLVPWDAPVSQSIAMTLSNPFTTAISGTFSWTIPPGWKVEPSELAFSVEPGAQTTLTVQAASDGPARFPVPSLSGTVQNPENGQPLELMASLNMIPAVHAPQPTVPMNIDGDLTEWEKAVPLALNYGSGYDVKSTEDLKASTRVMWDAGNLYIAVEVEDNEFYQPYDNDIVWEADGVELWIDDSNWSLTLTPKGTEAYVDERPDKHLDSVDKAVALAVKRDGRRTVYEAAYPASELPQTQYVAGNTIRFSLLVNDQDTKGPLPNRHYAELTPGAGEHFVCPKVSIILDGK